MEAINTILEGITNGSSIFITGKAALIGMIVSIVLSLLVAVLGLKLIRIWNVLVGLTAGVVIGAIVAAVLNLEMIPLLIVMGVAGLILAILNGVFKKFGAFWVCFFGVAGVLLTIIDINNWIALAVCGAIGLIFAILAMIWFEPFVIIATALNGGFGAGQAIYELAGLKNVLLLWIISIVLTAIGLAIQFVMKSSEINKKDVKRANAIKKEISKEEEIEMARTMLIDLDDDEDDDE